MYVVLTCIRTISHRNTRNCSTSYLTALCFLATNAHVKTGVMQNLEITNPITLWARQPTYFDDWYRCTNNRGRDDHVLTDWCLRATWSFPTSASPPAPLKGYSTVRKSEQCQNVLSSSGNKKEHGITKQVREKDRQKGVSPTRFVKASDSRVMSIRILCSRALKQVEGYSVYAGRKEWASKWLSGCLKKIAIIQR